MPVQAGLHSPYKIVLERVRALGKSQYNTYGSGVNLHGVNHSKGCQRGVSLCGVRNLSQP
jgi:hypothetical protein